MRRSRGRRETDHEERDLERRKESKVRVKERHGIGDLYDSVVLRADSTDEDSVDRRRLVAQGVENEFNVCVLGDLILQFAVTSHSHLNQTRSETH